MSLTACDNSPLDDKHASRTPSVSALGASMNRSARYTVREEACLPRPGRRPPEKLYSEPALGVVLSGSFDYRAQNGEAIAVPGTVLLGNRAEHFECHPHNCVGNRRLAVYFQSDFLAEVADSYGLVARFQVAAIPSGRFSAAAFGWIRRVVLQREDHEEAAYKLALAALRVSRPGLKPIVVSSLNQKRVLNIVRHIENYYHEPCSLKALARLVRLSPCYFLRVFQRVTGQSPAQYVMHVRLRAAADNLLTTCAPIGEVALNAGFNDISHFNASFRKVFGRNPTHWRLR